VATSIGYPLHRPELYDALCQGDALLLRAMAGNQAVFEEGRRLIQTGKESDAIYRLRTGWLARTRTIEDGRRQIMMVFLPGDLVGVKSMLLREQPDSVECLSSVTVDVIEHTQARRLVESNGPIALRMLFQLGEDERRLHNWAVGLGRGNAEERIATMLLDFRGRLQRIGLLARDTYRLPMTQQEIGDYLGLTVVHVNRVLRRLREADLATVRNGTVMIHDAAALHKIARPLLDVFERTAPEFGALSQPSGADTGRQ
jgi:CRP/FNR family transcriptional regulator, anaerobic regulatory protein